MSASCTLREPQRASAPSIQRGTSDRERAKVDVRTTKAERADIGERPNWDERASHIARTNRGKRAIYLESPKQQEREPTQQRARTARL
jgi:hypothetical protein